ncbi:ATP-binding protein [Sphingobium sp.]|uniref:sensor histidine kinase n=1 Tax=Sphingobium sp. TaxID=1912891 RepID=UPI003B3BB2BC
MSDIIDLAGESIVIYDLDGVVRYWNAASQHLYGWAATDVIGRHMDRFAGSFWLPHDDWRHVGQWSGVVQRLDRAGQAVLVAVRLTLRRDQSGRPIDIVEFGNSASVAETAGGGDTVEPFGKEGDGRAGLLDGLLQHMPIALWEIDSRRAWTEFEQLRASGLTDIRGYIADRPNLVETAIDNVLVTRVNRAAILLLGADDERQLLRPVRYLFDLAIATAERIMVAHFEGRRTYMEELRVNTFDGRVVDVMVVAVYPRPTDDLDTTFVIMLEIGDRLAAEAQLRQHQANLAHAARLSTLGELVTSIAHEVKQPLSAIRMNGEITLKRLGQDPPNLARVKLLTRRVIESATQATDIIGRIQGMTSKQAPVWSTLSLNAIVIDALRIIHHDSLEKRVHIKLALSSGLPDIGGDKVQLQQVAVNLLVNAIQAIDHGPADARREIIVTTRQLDDAMVELSVEDSGPGISDDHLDSLFDGFFTTKDAGMGMGLTICQTIMRMHEGDIEAHNRADGGARFACRLPVGNGRGPNDPSQGRWGMNGHRPPDGASAIMG